MEEALTVPSGDCGKVEEARKDEQLKGRSGDLLRGLVLGGGGHRGLFHGSDRKKRTCRTPEKLLHTERFSASPWRSHSPATGRTAGLRPDP